MADDDAWHDAALRLLWERTPDIVSVVGPDDAGNFVVVDANERLIESTGWALEDVIGVPMSDLLPPHEAAAQEAELRSVFERGEPVAYEVVRHVPTGRRTYAYTLHPIRDTTGRVVRAVAISRDVTALQMAEENARALEVAHQRQEQAVELNDDVLQGLSVAGLALELGDLDAVQEALDRTMEAVRHIISGLLAHREGVPLGPGDLVRERAAGRQS